MSLIKLSLDGNNLIIPAQFFGRIIFPPAPDYTVRTHYSHFKIILKSAKVFETQGAPNSGANDTSGKWENILTEWFLTF